MMKTLYLLQHSYQYGENDEYDEIKTLGIFESEESVKQAIDFYKTLPGFRDFSDECFSFDRYVLNKKEWSEGFYEE